MSRHVLALDPALARLAWVALMTAWAFVALWWVDRWGPRRPPAAR